MILNGFSRIENGLTYLLFILFMRCGIMGLGVLVGQRSRRNYDKLVSFECGFDPIRRSRTPFSFRFFLLALLFLVFDVEVVLIMSFCFRLKIVFFSISSISVVFCFVFLVILLGGLIHEANEGALS